MSMVDFFNGFEKRAGLFDFLKKKQEEHLTPENMRGMGIGSRRVILPLMSGFTGKSIEEIEREMQNYNGLPVRIVHEKSGSENIPGGKADGMKPSQFDEKQLREGVKVEKEHTGSTGKAREIVMDHIIEAKKKNSEGKYVSPYYKKLHKLEKSI